MNKNRAFLIDATVFGFFFLVTLTEYELVEPRLQSLYIGSRIMLLSSIALHAAFWRYSDKIWYGIVWAFILYSYSVLGEIFRPLYIIALFQLQAVHAVYFRHTRRTFVATHLIGTSIFLLVMTLNWDRNLVRLKEAAVLDQVAIAFTSLAVAAILYFHFEVVKTRAEKATNKLALIGSYATSLIHDIKNLSSSPLLYAEMLNNDSRELSKADISKVAELLHADLMKLEKLVKELYDTSKPEDQSEVCSLREAVEFAVRIVSTRLKGVTLTIEGDSKVQTNKRILNVILLNLFYNSLNAFKAYSPDEARLIEIKINGRVMTYISHSFKPGPETQESDMLEDRGLGLYLIEELGKQSNVFIERDVVQNKWITKLRFT